MVIVRMQGGLGNQLFQYALYKTIKEKGIQVKADISDYILKRDSRNYELDKLGLQIDIATNDELHHYYADNTRPLDRLLRYTIGKHKYLKEKCFDYNSWTLQVEDGYLSGYWQSERYFQGISEKLRNNITFQNINTLQIQEYEGLMKSCQSVSVHLRRGDYEKNDTLYGNIATVDYYYKAIEYIQEKVENPKFFLFSDDQVWAEQFMKSVGQSYVIVQGNTGDNAYKDMYLMTCCRYHVIANSTFSWWGAWLDNRKDKVVITPDKWNNLCKGHEICADGWTMIS